MAFSNLGYSMREAGHHFRRNWTTAFGAIVTIFLSLFIIGTFAMGSEMLTNLVGDVESRVTIQAFLSDDTAKSDVDALQSKIEGWDNIESVTYKSKDEALEEYKQTMSNKNAAEAVAALDGENPVPASLVISLDDPQLVSDTAEKLIADADFVAVCDDPDNVSASVQYGRGTVERLFSVTNYIRIAAVVLVALLTFVSFVFINNTIRLAITARRREIAIERLVGASNGFIRGPFLMEGLLEGFIGSVLAVAALYAGMGYVIPRLESSLQFLSFEVPLMHQLYIYGGMVAIGIVLGVLGSAIAMRRYLKV